MIKPYGAILSYWFLVFGGRFGAKSRHPLKAADRQECVLTRLPVPPLRMTTIETGFG